MRLLALPAAVSVLTFTSALPSPAAYEPLPVLVWHGLGDRHDAEGLHSVGDLVKEVHPKTYVHYIRIDDNGDNDRSATFFGNVTEQVSQVCQQLKENDDLLTASYIATTKREEIVVDAIGFSQGGQFLRGLLQRCEGLKIRSLVTFGSQHNGVAEVKACGQWDLLCKGAIALMRSNAWTDYVQSHVVPAQYYRTLNESTGEADEEYLEHSNFLADINNEREEKNETYKERLQTLEKFVMYMFEEDMTVIPRESSWFAEVVNGSRADDEERVVVPLKERAIYKEDWLGLKKLDEKGALVFKKHPGDHMQLDSKVLKEAFKEYFGPPIKNAVIKGCTEHYSRGYLQGWWDEIKVAWASRRELYNMWWDGKPDLYRQGL